MREAQVVQTGYTSNCPECSNSAHFQGLEFTIEKFVHLCLGCENEFIVRNPFFQLKTPSVDPSKNYKFVVHPLAKSEDGTFSVCWHTGCTLKTFNLGRVSYRVIITGLGSMATFVDGMWVAASHFREGKEDLQATAKDYELAIDLDKNNVILRVEESK